MSMTRTPFYEGPKQWSEIDRIKIKMRVDLLQSCGEHASDAGKAAALAGMSRNAYVSACRRFGVPVEHLLDLNSGNLRLRERS